MRKYHSKFGQISRNRRTRPIFEKASCFDLGVGPTVTYTSPRLFAKFNYRIKWFDGWENHKLNLENYNSGPAAPYNSWALLEKED